MIFKTLSRSTRRYYGRYETIVKKENGVASTSLQILVLLIVILTIGSVIYVRVTRPPREPAVSEVQSLSITSSSSTTVGSVNSIVVSAYDAEGNPVSGANLSLCYTMSDVKDPWVSGVALVDRGDGTYVGNLSSERAGSYQLVALAEDGTIKTTKDVEFKPGGAANVEISFTSPEPNSTYYTSTLTFYFTDQYGNLVPQEEVEPHVETTFGEVGELQWNADDTCSVDLNAENWGTAEVTVSDNNTGVSASEEIEFTPIHAELSYDLVKPVIEFASLENLEFISMGDNQLLSLDIGIFFPPSLGTLGGYEVKVEYDNSILKVEEVIDPDPTDNLEAPEWWICDNNIYLTQFGSAAQPAVQIATVHFSIWESVKNVWENLKEKAGKIITWVENLWNKLWEPVAIPPGTVVENGKVFKKLFIPLKIWIVDNVRDEENVRKIAEITENIYNMNALRCRFKYWFVYLVEINHISENEWNSKVPTGHIEGDDNTDPWYPEPAAENQRKKLVEQNKWERWVNVYWLPDNAFGEFGWYKDNVIFIDNAWEGKDNHITLAHELAHLLSGGKVEDPTSATGKSQGADNYCNLMAYDLNKSHGNLTENQAKLIEEWIDNHSEERPAADGGGRILKPVPY